MDKIKMKRYIDASVCAKTFQLVADEWWSVYEAFETNFYKTVCLKEYYKWKKYAEIFNKE